MGQSNLGADWLTDLAPYLTKLSCLGLGWPLRFHKAHLSDGCLPEASVSYHVDVLLGLLEYPHSMAAGFPRVKEPERERSGREEATVLFMGS